MQRSKGILIAYSKPLALEICSGSVQYLIDVNSEYVRHKGHVMTAKHTPGCVLVYIPWLHRDVANAHSNAVWCVRVC